MFFKLDSGIAYSIYGPTTRGRIVTKDGLEVISYFAPGYGQYGTWTIRYGHFATDNSVRGQFGTWTIREVDNSGGGQFGTWTFAM